MLKVLFRKQITEMFRSVIYDQKKGKAKSRSGIIGTIILYVILFVVILGGIFTGMAVSLCKPLTDVDMGWLYFALTGLVALLLGLFGSVFNTFASLYMAKDNELLLSMPIPVHCIILSRLLGVYALGVLYSGLVFLPAVIVYQIVCGFSLNALIGSVLMFLVITLIVLVLSCALGWVVAKIAGKLKNKSMITVIISVAFIVAYYIFYFRIVSFISEFILNAAEWGDKIKGSAYPLYLFGRMGEGDWLGIAVSLAVTAALCGLVYWLISRSFIKTALSTGTSVKVAYKESKSKTRSVDAALLAREGKRLTSSANYMLNAALGVLFIPVMTVVIAVAGNNIISLLNEVFGEGGIGITVAFLLGILIMMSGMTMTAAPAVSMEGKSLWLVRSLPVTEKQILNAKLRLQLLLSCIPSLLFCIVTAIVMVPVLHPDIFTVILFLILPQLFNIFYAQILLLLGIKHAILDWTSETIAIKQNVGSLLSVLFAWGYGIVFVGLAFALCPLIGSALYLLIFCVLTAGLVALFGHRINTKGVERFRELK